MTDYNKLSEYAQNPAQLRYAQAIASGLSQSQTAKKFDVNSRSVERSLAALKRAAAKMGYAPGNDQTRPVPDGQVLRGVSTLYDDEGNVKAQWVKSQTQNEVDTHKSIKEFAEGFFEPYRGKIKPVKAPKSFNEDLLTSIFIGDPHLGMLAWGKRTGYENFDTDIGVREFVAAVIHMIDQAPKSAELIINQKGDLFHSDGDRPFTPASGHLLDVDGRFSYTWRKAGSAYRVIIAHALKKFPKVVIMNDRGNHDETTAVLFNIMLQMFYENEPRVVIPDNEQKLRYYNWGNTGLWFDHSHKTSPQRLIGQITTKFSKAWGETLYRYGHFGHKHHDHTFKNENGIKAHWHPTLAPPDMHHADAGYGYSPAINSISYSKLYGEDVSYSAPLARIRATMASAD